MIMAAFRDEDAGRAITYLETIRALAPHYPKLKIRACVTSGGLQVIRSKRIGRNFEGDAAIIAARMCNGLSSGALGVATEAVPYVGSIGALRDAQVSGKPHDGEVFDCSIIDGWFTKRASRQTPTSDQEELSTMAVVTPEKPEGSEYLGTRLTGAEDVWDATRASDDPAFHEFVCSIYTEAPLLQVAGRRYPCAVYLPTKDQKGNVNSIFGKLSVDPRSNQLIEGREYLETVLDTARARNGSLFAITHVATEDRLTINCRVCRYFDVLSTCDALRYEIQREWMVSQGQIKNKSEPLAGLPMRSRLHDKVSDPIRCGAHRAAGIAVSTLVCHVDDDGYRCILQRRSNQKLAVDRNRFHVIPAAMFEANPDDVLRTFSVRENILREYAEELFDYPEAHAVDHPPLYQNTPEVGALLTFIERGQASIHLTGLAVNLLNMRPEICTLLLIRAPEWRTMDFGRRLNWEYAQTGSEESFGQSVPLGNEKDLLENYRLAPEDMVIPGAAAFWLGMRAAKEILE